MMFEDLGKKKYLFPSLKYNECTKLTNLRKLMGDEFINRCTNLLQQTLASCLGIFPDFT